MEDRFIIQGGRPLGGEIEVRGAKNAVFPLLAASILAKGECVISNIPLIEDVFRMIEILKELGAKISWRGEREIKIKTSGIEAEKLCSDSAVDLVTKLRGSVLFLGPLLARFGKIKMARPGGCFIGARPIDTHLDVFRQLGAKVSFDGDLYELELSDRSPKVRQIVLSEFSVTSTENALLFAALGSGRTVIKCADTDYQVQELANFLRKMGVKIDFLPFHEIVVWGRSELDGAEHELMPDPIEAGTFILTAAAGKGRVNVKKAPIQFLDLFLKKLGEFGVPYELSQEGDGWGEVRVMPWRELRGCRVQSWTYPGLQSDLLSAFGVLATQATGVTLMHDPLYEGRLKYLEEINRMGANIIFCDPHRVIIQGPTKLLARILKTTDLRGGAALLIAGLIAEGETVINNVYQIDRGYERIEERLRNIGADIRRIKS